MKVLQEIWALLAIMSPWLLFGFLFAGILNVLITPAFVERHLSGKSFFNIVKASLLGIPLPLCSCGVIPVATSLSRHGSSNGAVVSFLVSTPQTGVDSIAVSYGVLGPAITVCRIITAFISGIFCGWSVSTFDKSAKIATGKPSANRNGSSVISRIFHYGFIELPADIGKSLIVGIILSGVMTYFLPSSLETWLGISDSVWIELRNMLVMVLVGLPLYICSTSSVPIVWSLLMKGVSPGAGIVFLIMGPATNAASVVTLTKVIGKRSTFIYLFSLILIALTVGITFDFLPFAKNLQEQQIAVHEHVGIFPSICGAILAVLIIYVSYIRPLFNKSANDCEDCGCETEDCETESRIEFKIEGLNCGRCVKSVTRNLLELTSVEDVELTLLTGKCIVTGANLDLIEITNIINELGFSVKE